MHVTNKTVHSSDAGESLGYYDGVVFLSQQLSGKSIVTIPLYDDVETDGSQIKVKLVKNDKTVSSISGIEV